MVDKQQLAAMGEHMREMEECKPEFKVPDGWKLVPVAPTSEMISAGNAELAYDCCSGTADEAWPAMLAAAPEYKP